MALSKVVNENEEYIKDAINNGVGGEAIGSTLNDVISKVETPKQVKETVNVIVEMKSGVNNVNNEEYASNLVKENSEKIKNALNDGVTPTEVANTLVNNTKETSNKNRLNFIVRLISKMKRKELKLKKDKTNVDEKKEGYQRVFK